MAADPLTNPATPFAIAIPRLATIATNTVSVLSPSSCAMPPALPRQAERYPPPVARAEVLVASNRGPVAFRFGDDGRMRMTRGGGGLVSGVSAAASDGVAVWVCAALSDADRIAAGAAPGGRLDRAGHDTGGAAVRMLPIDETTFRRAYNAVANSTLWYVNHTLFDTPRHPSFDARWARYWHAYVDYNRAFAEALAEEAAPGARVLVQDYHLFLVPAQLRALRPDLRIAHFTHTPWRSRRTSPCCPMRSAPRSSKECSAPTAWVSIRLVGWRPSSAAASGCSVRRPGATPCTTPAGRRSSAFTRWASTARSLRRARARQTWPHGGTRSDGEWVTARSCCGSTAPSCPRTSSAVWRRTVSCCAPSPSPAATSSISCSRPRPATTC